MKKIRKIVAAFMLIISLTVTGCSSETELSRIYSKLENTEGISLSSDKKQLTIEYEKNSLSFVDEYEVLILGIYDELGIGYNEQVHGNEEFAIESTREDSKRIVTISEK